MEPFFLEKIGEGKGVKKGRGKIYSFVVCFLYFLRSYLKKSIKGKIPSVSVSESWIATKPTPPISLIMFRALWPKSLEIGNEPGNQMVTRGFLWKLSPQKRGASDDRINDDDDMFLILYLFHLK